MIKWIVAILILDLVYFALLKIDKKLIENRNDV